MVELYRREGSPFWYIKGIRRSTGCTRKADALRTANKIVAELEEEARQRLLKSDGLLWADAAKAFLESGTLKPSTAGRHLYTSMIVLNAMGNFNLKALSQADIRRFIQERRKVVNDATIKRNISMISAVIAWSIARQLPGCPETNVLRNFDRSILHERKPVDRHLRANQFQAVLDACTNDEHRRIVIVLAGTGLRSGELLGLKWSEVNLKDRLIEFGHLDPSRSKTGRSRKIPLLDEVHSALVAQKVAQSDPKPESLVFPSNVRGKKRHSFSYLKNLIKKRSGLKSFRIHDLRHSYASWLLQRGVDPLAIRDLLGHTTLSTTTRYAGYLSDQVADQIRQIGIPQLAHSVAQSTGLNGTTTTESPNFLDQSQADPVAQQDRATVS